MKHLWQQDCYRWKIHQSLMHVFWAVCEELAHLCKVRNWVPALSCHQDFPGQCALLSNLRQWESDSEIWLCLRQHCSQASDSRFFQHCSLTLLSLTNISYVKHICGWSNMWQTSNDRSRNGQKTWLVKLHSKFNSRCRLI